MQQYYGVYKSQESIFFLLSNTLNDLSQFVNNGTKYKNFVEQ